MSMVVCRGAGWRSQPKDRRRAEDKVNKRQGDASKLLDLAGAKVEFRTLDDLYAALEQDETVRAS